MVASVRDYAEYSFGARLKIFRATSRHLSALYPFHVEPGYVDPETGRKIPGLPIGYCGENRSGGVLFFDEPQLYQAKRLGNANCLVYGRLNQGKSSYIKRMIFRGSGWYNHLVTDLKGEYTDLANKIPRSKVLEFGKKGRFYINPVDNLMSIETQNSLLAAMLLTALGKNRVDLTETETPLLGLAIEEAHVDEGDQGIVLSNVANLLFEPNERMAHAMYRTKDEVREMGYHLALATKRLISGNLSGMFDQRTTPGLFEETPLLVLSCVGLEGAEAAIMITLINFFTQSLWARANPDHRIHKVIHDEAWKLAKFPGFVRSLQEAFKLGGTFGVANYIVAHHQSNLAGSGIDDAIKSLTADSDTRIVFRQDPKEIRDSAELLGFSDSEIELATILPEHHFILKTPDRPGILVDARDLWPEEHAFVETRHLMKGMSVLENA